MFRCYAYTRFRQRVRFRSLPLLRRFRKKLTCRRFLMITVLISVFLVILYPIQNAAAPALLSLAEPKGRETVNLAVSEAVGSCSIDSVLDLHYGTDGKITSITVNSDVLNQYQVQVTQAVNQELRRLRRIKIAVPVGSLTDFLPLVGKGPSVSVKLLPYGDSEILLHSGFESAGLNQTLHRITLEVKTKVRLLTFGGQSSDFELLTILSVSETVIVGEVPSYYKE